MGRGAVDEFARLKEEALCRHVVRADLDRDTLGYRLVHANSRAYVAPLPPYARAADLYRRIHDWLILLHEVGA
jgi:hypothetical protein